jgi:hypothetical protein
MPDNERRAVPPLGRLALGIVGHPARRVHDLVRDLFGGGPDLVFHRATNLLDRFVELFTSVLPHIHGLLLELVDAFSIGRRSRARRTRNGTSAVRLKARAVG